jgi:hypothetical protein
MSLTKVSYSMITGSPVNVFDYLTPAQITAVQTNNYSGVADITSAVQSAITYIANTSGTLYFPQGVYQVTASLNMGVATSGQVLGCVIMGSGNGDVTTSAPGTVIKYVGAAISGPVLSATNTVGSVQAFVGNTVSNINFDANLLAQSCVHLDAYNTSPTLNKSWTFTNCTFKNAGRFTVLVGQNTWNEGTASFTAATNDSDAHLNVFNQCQFFSGTGTIYHVVLNVYANCYQTTLRDCSNNGTNVQLFNFLLQITANQTAIYNLFAGAFYQVSGGTVTTNVGVLRVLQGSLEVFGLDSEEPRILVRRPSGAANNQVALYSVDVNKETNPTSGGTYWTAIDDTSTAPLTLVDCKFQSTNTYSRIVTSNSININAVGATVGLNGTAPFEWTNISLAAGWSNVGSPYAPAQYRIQPNGVLQLRGAITGGAGNSTIFTLPATVLINYDQWCPVDFDHAFGTVGLSVAGVLSWGLVTSSAGKNVYLDGAQFSLRTY